MPATLIIKRVQQHNDTLSACSIMLKLMSLFAVGFRPTLISILTAQLFLPTSAPDLFGVCFFCFSLS